MIDFSNCPIDESWQLVDPDGNVQMINSELQFNYARLQIAKNRLTGYYLVSMRGDEKYEINEHGKVDYVEGLFTSNYELSDKLLRIGVERWNERSSAKTRALKIKKEFCLLENPKKIMNVLGYVYDDTKSFTANCKDFLKEKEDSGELYTVWNAMHPDELIRIL